MRCAETTFASYGTPNSCRIATACFITSQSELEPISTPTTGALCVCAVCASLIWLFPVSGYASDCPVRRSKRFLDTSRPVLAITSSGSFGAGGSFFHGCVSSQSRTNCLSNDGGFVPT